MNSNEELEQVFGGAGAAERKAVIVNCEAADMLDQPDGRVISAIPCGREVTFLAWVGNWGNVVCRSRFGFIHKDFLSVQ